MTDEPGQDSRNPELEGRRKISPASDPDPYICQRCGEYYPYLDMMGSPQCDCGSTSFWPVTPESMSNTALAIIVSLGKRWREEKRNAIEYEETGRMVLEWANNYKRKLDGVKKWAEYIISIEDEMQEPQLRHPKAVAQSFLDLLKAPADPPPPEREMTGEELASWGDV